MNVERCAHCPTILRYETADGRWVEMPAPRHTCRPPHKGIKWEIERDADGTPRRMWWVG